MTVTFVLVSRDLVMSICRPSWVSWWVKSSESSGWCSWLNWVLQVPFSALPFAIVALVTGKAPCVGHRSCTRIGLALFPGRRSYEVTKSGFSFLWPPCIADADIVLVSSFFLSSPNLRLDVYHTWCGLSANLICRSETCCTWFAENTGRKKLPKIRHLRTIVQLCWAIS